MKTARTSSAPIGALIAVVALAGCIRFQQDYPEKRLFLIKATRPERATAPADAPTLLVRRFSISQAFEREEFVYRRGEHAYDSDFYNAFFATPQTMIGEICTQWLADSGLFAQVNYAASRLDTRLLLEGHIVSLHADLRESEKPQAVLEIAFVLIDEAGEAGPRVLFQKTWREVTPIASPAAQNLAAGLSGALGRILTELEAELGSAMRK